MNLAQQFAWPGHLATADSLDAEARRVVGAGLEVGAEFMADALRGILGVQAPLAVSSGSPRRGPRVRAATPATPGAPPRRVTSRLYFHVAAGQEDESTYLVGITAPVPYAARHNFGGHPFMQPLLDQNLGRLESIVGQAIRAEIM